ncbi:MAG: MTAP family purine nucleoside phosphorylase [Candidatus Bilamarchaeaceae archaeon]
MLGMIGGTGFYFLKGKEKRERIETPFGEAVVQRTKIFKKDVVFIPRHGETHAIPPHKINYKANLWALKELGVTAVFGIYATGILSRRYRPGDLILIDDFIGLFTPITFFDDFSDGMKHIDFSRPYDKKLKGILLARAKTNHIRLKDGGIVATTVGPRFETRAEIRALSMLGANLVSMTHGYEATLVGELEIPFAALAIGTNYACGIAKHRLSWEEVVRVLEEQKGKVITLVDELIKEVE